jgi:hypothetical protein
VQRWKPLWLSGDGKKGGVPLRLLLRGFRKAMSVPDIRGIVMMKIVLATAASLAMLSAAAAADLPRKEPLPPAPAPVGKAPIGKFPIGKYPGKYPTPGPVVTKG